MELVKKNILSIICGVVALAAIVFHLVYTTSGFSELKTQAQARADKEQDVERLRTAQYSMPAGQIDAEPQPLDRFPNEATIKVAEGVVSKVAAQANGLVKQAVAINRAGYNLIVPDALPTPTDPRKYEFREQYNRVLMRGGQPRNYDPQNPVQNLPDAVLQSAVPPTDLEILEAKSKKWKDEYLPKLIIVNGVPINQKEVVSNYLKQTANFDVDFRKRRAQEFKVYLDPAALTISPRLDLAARAAPAVEDMWFGQMSLWIQQDVCNAIARQNAKSNSIPSSPVKHLVVVQVRQDASMYILPGGIQAIPADGVLPAAPLPPQPGFSNEESGEGGEEGGEGGEEGSGDPFAGAIGAPAAPAAQPRNYTLSPTGRVCPTPPAQGLYDVVHFEFIVVVDRQLVRNFIQQVQSGRLITVLEADLQNIDLTEAVNQGYDYGSRPVVEMRIKCEALFLREWTVENNGPMPSIVRTMLGIPPAAPPAQPAAVAQQ